MRQRVQRGSIFLLPQEGVLAGLHLGDRVSFFVELGFLRIFFGMHV